MFPILFVVGPEGFGHVSPAGSVIGRPLFHIARHVIQRFVNPRLWSQTASRHDEASGIC